MTHNEITEALALMVRLDIIAADAANAHAQEVGK